MSDEGLGDFNVAIEEVVKDGTEQVTIRPDVQAIAVNREAAERHRELFRSLTNLILKRMETPGPEKPTVRLTDGFPFTFLAGCLRCGYVIHETHDVTDKCEHCPMGQGSDLYITRRKAYMLAMVGSLLGFWKLWPSVKDEHLWETDRNMGPLASLPLLTADAMQEP